VDQWTLDTLNERTSDLCDRKYYLVELYSSEPELITFLQGVHGKNELMRRLSLVYGKTMIDKQND